ncbi:MAG: ABC transporter permease [Bacteroidota bacterium]
MFKNYFTIGWRTLIRNKGYSAINIGGLAAGMAVTILISMWIYDELSYNKSFENYDRIGDVAFHNGDGTNFSNPIPLAWELRENFSQDLKHVALFTWPQDIAITSGENKFKSSGTFVEHEFTEIFSPSMIYGTRNALTEPNTILISKSLSIRMFGNTDPIGQVVRLRDVVDARIGGVYKDFDANTEFNGLNIIGSWEILLSWVEWMKESQDRWDNNSHKIFVQLNDGVSFEEISEKN